MNNVFENKMNIQKTESSFHSFFDHSENGMVLADSAGTVREWNKGYEQITGLSKESVIGKMFLWDVAESVFPFEKQTREECNMMKAELKKIVADMQQKNLICHVKHTITGECRIFKVLYFPVETPEGIMLLGGISRDLTNEMAFREQLEKKERELAAKQKDLEIRSRRQDILIKVLKIIQSAENLPQALNTSIAEIGKYAGVNRIYIFEKNIDGTAVSCTYEWCDKGISGIFDKFQNVPVKTIQPWFDIFDAGEIVNASDINSLHPEIVKILTDCGVKSIIDLPLTENGVHYGFVGFDECIENREWEQNEVELLKSLSQIISGAIYRYRTETAIRLSQQTMRKVLDNISAHVYVVDFNTREILFANKSLKKVAGEDIEGKVCWKVLQADQTGVCGFCPRKYLNDSKQCPTDVFRWENYNYLFGKCYSYDISTIEWIDGQQVMLGIGYDITDQKQTEKELIRAKEKAEEADKLKSAFLANMSHEIRTPLNGITGFLRFLASDNLTQERKHEYIDVINNSSMQLLKLIDDIVDVAKIEAKQMNINPIPVQINSLMKELHVFFETYLQVNNKGHIMLILDDSGFIDNCVTMVDPIRLRQVISNLIGNAIKFTEKGYIRFGYRQTAPDQLEFVVEDTGIGLASKQHEVIFERFRQAELNTNRLYGGTGLGLNISSNLVQLMGGDIRVESAEGAGSSFYFTISYQPVTDENCIFSQAS